MDIKATEKTTAALEDLRITYGKAADSARRYGEAVERLADAFARFAGKLRPSRGKRRHIRREKAAGRGRG